MDIEPATIQADELDASEPAIAIASYPDGCKGDRQALVGMQRVLWARVQDATIPAHIQAQCARAWRDLQDMKRIMDGKPLPGQLRPDLAQSATAKRIGPPARARVLQVMPKPAVVSQQSMLSEPPAQG